MVISIFRESSNPSFSAKKKTLEPQRFKGFFFVFQWFFRISGRYGKTRENARESCKNPVVIHKLLTCLGLQLSAPVLHPLSFLS